MLKASLTTLGLLSTLLSTYTYADSCPGQVFGINAGRGDIGILFGLDEGAGQASANSLAAFSSAALAYDTSSARWYYASAPRPIDYKVDTSHLNLPADADIPIEGKKHRYVQLAYFDGTSHTIVGRTAYLVGLAYDSTNDRLIGTSYDSIYSIDKNTGDATKLSDLPSLAGKYRGDLEFYNGRLILVTSAAVYQVNTNDFSVTKLSDHDLTSVTGASLNSNGELIISRVIINDAGHTNKSAIYKLNPDTGSTCYINTLPIRVNDLAYNPNGSSTCYTVSGCGGTPTPPSPPSFTLTSIENAVYEGSTLSYQITLSKAFEQDVSFSVAVNDVTTQSDDYVAPPTSLEIPAGSTTATIQIATIDDTEYTGDRELSLSVTGVSNTSGNETLSGNILDNETACVPDNYTRINYAFVREDSLFNNDWGIKVNGQYIKLLDEYGSAGSYDILQGQSFTYVLAIDGNSNALSTKYQVSGTSQRWEDQNDNDYNDFEVSVTTQTIQKGCN